MKGDPAIEEWLPPDMPLHAPVASPPVVAVNGSNGLPGARKGSHAIDLNEVDFDGLIALGISVGQAARFISRRERRGGVGALNELDAYHGLAPAVRDLLRSRGRI